MTTSREAAIGLIAVVPVCHQNFGAELPPGVLRGCPSCRDCQKVRFCSYHLLIDSHVLMVSDCIGIHCRSHGYREYIVIFGSTV